MLKRTVVFIFSIILVFSLIVFNNTPLFNEYSCEYEVFIKSGSNINSVKKVSKSKYIWCFGIKGESCVIEKQDFCLSDFFNDLNADELFSEKVGEIVVYYAFSPQIKYREKVQGETVNLQVAVSENYVKVGSPLIYGSF